jgi:DNA-binding Xre family transcriptional regulator
MTNTSPAKITVENSTLIRRVASQLTKIANDRGLTAQDLADITGLSYASVRNILDGKQNVSVLTIEDICKRLDVPLEVMLSVYLHEEPPRRTLNSRWGAKRAERAIASEQDRDAPHLADTPIDPDGQAR